MSEVSNEVLLCRENKIKQLNDDCTNTIYNGMDIKLSDDAIEHFTLDEHDQLNLTRLSLKIAAGEDSVYWHNSDKTKSCKKYSAKDINIIIAALTAFKEYHITYFRDLRIYVESLDNVDDIENIAYGYDIPYEYKSEALNHFYNQLKFCWGGIS